jgi:hypothetical protein
MRPLRLKKTRKVRNEFPPGFPDGRPCPYAPRNAAVGTVISERQHVWDNPVSAWLMPCSDDEYALCLGPLTE